MCAGFLFLVVVDRWMCSLLLLHYSESLVGGGFKLGLMYRGESGRVSWDRVFRLILECECHW